MVTRSTLAAGVVGALVSTLFAGPAVAAPSPGGNGIGDPYFPLDGNGGIDVEKYEIHDSYRFDTGRLSGRTVITLDATQDLSRFNLDFLLDVKGVTVDGEEARFAQRRKPELVITPRTAIAQGDQVSVVVRYAGRPAPIGYLGEKNWLADRHEVVAMNQPHMATWWFPANDHPSDKALMDISVTVPRNKQVFANGERVSRVVQGKQATTRYVAPEPMSTYLAMFAAGDFDVERGVRNGRPWTAVVSQQLTQRQREANMDLMRRTPAITEWLEEDLGAYPFSTVGGLVTGLDVGFALENQTLPTYPWLGRGYAWLVVHELAHQWFGDSVALKRWRDIWLNEGAASFMELRWDETHGGQSAADWLREQYDARPDASSFWDIPIGNPGADHIFAGPVYLRGAMTFQALRNRIGEDDFWELLQRWVSENQGGLGTRAQFEALAEEVSGLSLNSFFRVWLDLERKPADLQANGLG